MYSTQEEFNEAYSIAINEINKYKAQKNWFMVDVMSEQYFTLLQDNEGTNWVLPKEH